MSAFYHPASGMIITTGGTMYAYDVKRAEWLVIGKNIHSSFGEVLGINADLDRIVVAEGLGSPLRETREQQRHPACRPLSGAYTDVPTPGRPVANVYNGCPYVPSDRRHGLRLTPRRRNHLRIQQPDPHMESLHRRPHHRRPSHHIRGRGAENGPSSATRSAIDSSQSHQPA